MNEAELFLWYTLDAFCYIQDIIMSPNISIER